VSVGAGTAERVTVTADDATLPAVEGIAAILHAHGFVVERRVFVRAAAEEPRRVVLLALERPLPALVALWPRRRRCPVSARRLPPRSIRRERRTRRARSPPCNARGWARSPA